MELKNFIEKSLNEICDGIYAAKKISMINGIIVSLLQVA